MRGRNAIYEAEFRDALRRRPQLLSTRAGRNADYFKIYADNKQLERIDIMNWQVIYGRRGTGKTTLLGTFAEFKENYPGRETIPKDQRYACIKINMIDCLSIVHAGTDSNIRLDDETKSRVYFASFIINLGKQLYEMYANENNNSILYRLSVFSSKKNAIFDKVLDIVSKCTYGAPALELSKLKQNSSFFEHAQKKKKISASGEFNFDRAKFSVSSELGGGISSEEKTTSKTDTKTQVAFYKIDFGDIKNDIQELLDLIGIDTMFLLIDEWSELDKSAATAIQPSFAELLKRTFGGTKRFSIKIAAIKQQTKFMNKNKGGVPIGLELGGDIFPIDLDSVYAGRNNMLTRFYEELIFKHLIYCNEKLNDFEEKDEFGNGTGKPVDEFITFIFKERRVMGDIIKGSGRIPRDFIEIFDRIAQAKEYSINPQWGFADVRPEIQRHSISNKEENLGDDENTRYVFDTVINAVRQNENRMVLVPKSAKVEYLNTVADLYLKRILHDVTLEDLTTQVRHKYHAYYLDYGIYIDIFKHTGKISEGEHEEKCPLNPNMEPNEIIRYVLPLPVRTQKSPSNKQVAIKDEVSDASKRHRVGR